MTSAMIVQLIAVFGPQAITLINELIAVWDKPSLTVAEVQQILSVINTPFAQGLTATGSPSPSVTITATPKANPLQA